MRIDMPIFPPDYSYEIMGERQKASDWYNTQGFHHRWYMSIVRHVVCGCEWVFTLYVPNVSPAVFRDEGLDIYTLFYSSFQRMRTVSKEQTDNAMYFRGKKDSKQAKLSLFLASFATENFGDGPVHVPAKDEVEIRSRIVKSDNFEESGTFIHMHVIFNAFQVDYDTPPVDHLSL